MKTILMPATAALALAALAGDAPAPARTISPETIAMLDPTRLAAQTCGSRRGAGALRARIKLAAAVRIASVDADPRTALPAFPPRSDCQSRAPIRPSAIMSAGGCCSPTASTMQRRSPCSARRSGSIPTARSASGARPMRYGPNINAPMAPERSSQALAAVAQRASRLAGTRLAAPNAR